MLTGRAADGFAIERVSAPKASDILANQIRELVFGNQLRPGESLPSERELMVRSGLSRQSVREALRILEIQGLIEIRLGRNGGSYVRRPDSETVTQSLDLVIKRHGIQFQDLLAAREGIEPVAAAQAAVNRTADDLDQLEAVASDFEKSFHDIPSFLRANVVWHLAIVRTSHNPLFIAFMTSISQAIHAATNIEDFKTEEVRTVMIRAHMRVLEAVREGDPAKARRRMERHVSAYTEKMKELDPVQLEELSARAASAGVANDTK